MEHNRELRGWLPLREKLRTRDNRDELLDDPERTVVWEGIPFMFLPRTNDYPHCFYLDAYSFC